MTRKYLTSWGLDKPACPDFNSLSSKIGMEIDLHLYEAISFFFFLKTSQRSVYVVSGSYFSRLIIELVPKNHNNVRLVAQPFAKNDPRAAKRYSSAKQGPLLSDTQMAFLGLRRSVNQRCACRQRGSEK